MKISLAQACSGGSILLAIKARELEEAAQKLAEAETKEQAMAALSAAEKAGGSVQGAVDMVVDTINRNS